MKTKHIMNKVSTLILASVLLVSAATFISCSDSENKSETTKNKISLDVPDKAGATIKGVIYADDKGVEGVRVSDGVKTVVTDKDGFYWLESEKRHGYVFYTIPSGYEAVGKIKALPDFWRTLKKKQDSESTEKVEQHNFEMIAVNNDNHILIAATDLHLANRGTSSNDDMGQFFRNFILDANKFIDENAGTPIYTLILGDMTWDSYWYDNKYGPKEYKSTISTFRTPVFHVMGNHDNDPYVQGDFESEVAYKKALGPTYYSMNIGKIHYVILDNNVAINAGGAEGTVGDRAFDIYFTNEQLEWLKQDLAVVDKATPVVVGFHCPSHSNYNISFADRSALKTSNQTAEFVKCFEEYSNVHFLSGHTHYNMSMQPKANIREHNVAAVCETWWWTGKVSDKNLCRDGSPSGYQVFTANATNLNWYYKSVGQPAEKQFRTYDGNRVKEFFDKAEVKTILAKLPVANRPNEFASLEENAVVLNVWGYASDWKVEVLENGQSLPVTRIFVRDPLHRQYYDYARTKKDGKAPTTTTFFTVKNSHMFKAIATSPTATLTVKVTDAAGKVYTEEMARPKKFEDASMD